MRISVWSSDVCSSDLAGIDVAAIGAVRPRRPSEDAPAGGGSRRRGGRARSDQAADAVRPGDPQANCISRQIRSEEHTSELQSLMRISYAVFCLKKKKQTTTNIQRQTYYNRKS